ncbi:MAG TPA: metallophosphoesterase [Mesorhizobium sp.]|jgi:serine/threonine protein phosphatase 1
MSGIHLRDARAPEGMRLHAIGDVHGRLDLLYAMHRRIAEDMARDPPADWRIVHLGDYVDRGPASKGVLDFLIAVRAIEPRNIMLGGNHDVAFLDFLERPDASGVFALYGGVQTAKTYGVDLAIGNDAPAGQAEEALRSGHAQLLRAVPQSHVDFLRGLIFCASFGDFFFCHAGIRPGVALDRQDREDLIWIREAFHDYPGLYPKVIVHGHTPHRLPEIKANRVNVDTLAHKSGRLTALVVDGAKKEILTVVEDGSVQRSEAVTP